MVELTYSGTSIQFNFDILKAMFSELAGWYFRERSMLPAMPAASTSHLSTASTRDKNEESPVHNHRRERILRS